MVSEPGRKEKAGGNRTTAEGEGYCSIYLFDADRVRRARAEMLPEEQIADAAELFKLLGNPTRLRIIRALSCEELCVCDLSQVLGLSVSATSYQLQIMRKARIVRYRTEGKQAYYSLREPFVVKLLEETIEHGK